MKKLAIILFTIAFGGKSFAQQPAVVASDKTGWHKIGETTVNFEKDRDEVAVLLADKFAKIKFKVTDAAIDLTSCEVVYESGENQTISLNAPLKSMGESKVFDLNGGERSIKKIIFVYKTAPNSNDKKAHVEIWGLKTNADKNDHKKSDMNKK
jgi:serine/threonine-protein kinase RIO1